MPTPALLLCLVRGHARNGRLVSEDAQGFASACRRCGQAMRKDDHVGRWRVIDDRLPRSRVALVLAAIVGAVIAGVALAPRETPGQQTAFHIAQRPHYENAAT